MSEQYYVRAEVIGTNASGQKHVRLLANNADGIRFWTDEKSLLTTESSKDELIRLIETVACNGDEDFGSCPDRKYGRCREFAKVSYCAIQKLADHLIANGLVLQRQMPVTELLPKPPMEDSNV